MHELLFINKKTPYSASMYLLQIHIHIKLQQHEHFYTFLHVNLSENCHLSKNTCTSSTVLCRYTTLLRQTKDIALPLIYIYLCIHKDKSTVQTD